MCEPVDEDGKRHSENHADARAPLARPRAAARDGTILVVDDDHDILEVTRDVLESEGYLVKTAENGAEALEVLRAEPRPLLVLLDLMMPVMSGWRLLAELEARPELRTIPIVVLTAFDIPATPPGTVGSVRKPFGLVELLEIVERYACEPTNHGAPPGTITN